MLIAFSGIDGAGKSTQLELLQSYFSGIQRKTVYLWTRGGYTPGINWLKNFSRRLSGNRLPASGHSTEREAILGKGWVQKAWLVVAIIDLMWIYGIKIRLWLMQGKVVICDRYLWDTLIDFQIMFPDNTTEKWNLWKALVWVTPKPSIQFLLMMPLEESERRCQIKYEPFPDTPGRREQRYMLYQELSKLGDWYIIDASKPVDDVFASIVTEVCKKEVGSK